jgi:hypothetical protein
LAFQREAMENAGTTPQKLAELRGRIFKPSNFETSELQSTLRRMGRLVREPSWPAPPSQAERRRLNHTLTPGAVAALPQLGTDVHELFALAVLICTEQHSDCFGPCQSSADHGKRLVELALLRDELRQRIATEWTPADIETSEPDASGKVLITFRASRGLVPVHPAGNAGERLISFLLTP